MDQGRTRRKNKLLQTINMKTKAIQAFIETKYNVTFNRDEKVVSVGSQFENGVYYQTLRLPKYIEITEEQAKNLIDFIINHITKNK